MNSYDHQASVQGYENGPRRGEFDGYTYFGSEDIVYEENNNNSFQKDGYIENSRGI